jgi:predicted RNA binding protein YcfA (HicA-like mRNA interferase family)
MPKLSGVNHQEAIRALKKAGFRVAREGKHTIMTDDTRILTIPRHNPINAYTMAAIIRQV